MGKIKIINIKNDEILATGERFLDVEFEIRKGNNLLATHKLGFPVDTTEEDIEKELLKYLGTYESDQTNIIANKEENTKNEGINKVIENLKGKELTK